jgi:CheY-like chemotaxis protein
MRILYVEDNPANVALMQRIARMGNHSLINYGNGQSALDNLEADAPDVVLMDVQLKGPLDGLQVVKQLRERGVTLPIVAVTAYAMKGDQQRCLDAGCDEYLSKPIMVSAMVELLKRHDPANRSTLRPVTGDGVTS